jgi:hypothetical protein
MTGTLALASRLESRPVMTSRSNCCPARVKRADIRYDLGESTQETGARWPQRVRRHAEIGRVGSHGQPGISDYVCPERRILRS